MRGNGDNVAVRFDNDEGLGIGGIDVGPLNHFGVLCDRLEFSDREQVGQLTFLLAKFRRCLLFLVVGSLVIIVEEDFAPSRRLFFSSTSGC